MYLCAGSKARVQYYTELHSALAGSEIITAIGQINVIVSEFYYAWCEPLREHGGTCSEYLKGGCIDVAIEGIDNVDIICGSTTGVLKMDGISKCIGAIRYIALCACALRAYCFAVGVVRIDHGDAE